MDVRKCSDCRAGKDDHPCGGAMSIDLIRLLGAGWTMRQLEDYLDLMENCRRQLAQSHAPRFHVLS